MSSIQLGVGFFISTAHMCVESRKTTVYLGYGYILIERLAHLDRVQRHTFKYSQPHNTSQSISNIHEHPPPFPVAKTRNRKREIFFGKIFERQGRTTYSYEKEGIRCEQCMGRQQYFLEPRRRNRDSCSDHRSNTTHTCGSDSNNESVYNRGMEAHEQDDTRHAASNLDLER